ncbi:MAG: ABC transporter substrate-binding protein [Oscillospiraceae bacterium]|nr:ABC transporter substrate-binding protein [Oscillospiraceae bacterium]MBR2636407.1 ABC transporter substrate-binding protein [Oscillospiraceae bacterium]MBR6607198.1 ABC transporter substrate-binding protein [Oscillospiraceae bacterium]
MKMAKVLSLIMAFALCLGLFTGCGANNYTAKNTEYVIGLSGPLTGGAAVYGVAVQNSAQMAVDEINAAGGLNGVNFKLIATDDTNDATKVSTNYSSMLEQGMQVSLGCVTSAPGLEFTNLSAEDNVFFLTPSASADDIPKNDNGFQMCFADGNQGSGAAGYVNDNYKGQTIGVFYKSDDPYSNGIFKQFKENLDPSITVVETVFTAANESDFSSQISSLKDCSFIFMPIYYQPATIFMTQAKDQLAADTIYYGCDGFDGLEAEFDVNSVPQEITMLSHFNSKATDGAAAEFVKKYTEKYGADTLNQFGASAYDCVYAIYEAMKAAVDSGKEISVTISASDLCDILKEQFTGDFTFSGVTGEEIAWEDNGYVGKSAVKYVIKEATK